MPRPLCSLSLDLDNLWSYLKTHGDPGWDTYPSYLETIVPRVLALLKARGQKITWFIVGKDAAEPAHHPVLREITRQGHEVGNHSFHHEPWLHLYAERQIEDELSRTEDAIEAATGARPEGFRGPGFSFSPTLLTVLARRGYRYDCSTFPTFLGPLARMYYFATAKGLTADEKAQRKQLFGKLSEGFRPLAPYTWNTGAGPLLEIPVTTIPVMKTPFHLSYILFLAGFSKAAARAYLRVAVTMCKATGIEPSFLLHPLDFLGCDDTDRLAFFPAMKRPHAEKLEFVVEVFDLLAREFTLVPMGDHATAAARRLAAVTPVPVG
ncbi:polysaccharide deacetylase family protein [Fimbriiglobus ruber]|uniref:Polysaccharide deacetylase n=1 Tax=Fimbriiglobus ruber TaxID=1908690 RepID=A0A225DYY6_9BACT|nr:polysaccharide deacetylase family protein [Fimbriiglobus ruber]OWK42956.1 Polysaccharide deacetylase [Fimbriiglobus ruber]